MSSKPHFLQTFVNLKLIYQEYDHQMPWEEYYGLNASFSHFKLTADNQVPFGKRLAFRYS